MLQKNDRGRHLRRPVPTITRVRRDRQGHCRPGTASRTPRRSSCSWRSRRNRCSVGETCRQPQSRPSRPQFCQPPPTPGVSSYCPIQLGAGTSFSLYTVCPCSFTAQFIQRLSAFFQITRSFAVTQYMCGSRRQSQAQ